MISRVHCLSKTELSFLVKLFSFNTIFNIININCQIKWTLLIMYNNKYAENEDVVDFINLRNDEFSDENNLNKVNDEIWKMKICERSKILILNCSMFYFKFSFKNLYCTASHDVFLICFYFSAKTKGYNVNNTHAQNPVQTVSFFFYCKVMYAIVKLFNKIFKIILLEVTMQG